MSEETFFLKASAVFSMQYVTLAKIYNMVEKYQLQVNDAHDFELNVEDVASLDILYLDNAKAHFIHSNKSYNIQVLSEDFSSRTYKIQINNKTYEISIERPLDALIKELGLSLGSSVAANSISAPMPGIILDVLVAEGDEVAKGTPLCVLEAMKMENSLTSPQDGIIKTVTITKGETVEKGKLLIEFESND